MPLLIGLALFAWLVPLFGAYGLEFLERWVACQIKKGWPWAK